ncbi:ABC-type antimicrobial peptide transport system, permease component [Filimonas lacunae]|uniref:ABC-type antimicrobial peptide transport system, permease component n=1 Tax=Filimonas lacunae TaxID=477680 RepID=A0A173MLT0_9BACT|nr:ABC transporter permease [Filimonas lacunae]BAV08348.1 ABC transporter, permease protein [Filimonas lacunae]SIT33437.1 ABC-type antimicrobial peptide transport system, permease component [Filimonas lacunae]
MFRNYLLIAWRNLAKSKAASFINIAGLAAGLAVAVLISLWIWDELSFNHYHQQHDKIVQVMQTQTFAGKTLTGEAIPIPLDAELRKSYGSDFKYLVLSSWNNHHVLSNGNNTISQTGNYMDVDAPALLGLHMLAGSSNDLRDPSAVFLSQATAKALFGNTSALGKTLKLDNQDVLKVTGVYEDLPYNTTFRNLQFIATWQLYAADPWVKRCYTDWGNNSFQLFAQLQNNINYQQSAQHVKDAKLKVVDKDMASFKPVILLHPMNRWHLYGEFKNGVNIGGRIQFVWLFGGIGLFVLLLACINFMNLSTARSEKRCKEIGIRKAVGSLRSQLIIQFFCESMLTVFLALSVSILLVWLALPAFNRVADKQIQLPWLNGWCWLTLAVMGMITGFIAGSYPALYLSSFQPVKVLKGTYKTGWKAALPRQVLVVLQFTVSVILITGTVVVFKQIEFAKSRPTGYNNANLISIEAETRELTTHFLTIRNELLKTGAVTAVATSGSPVTGLHSNSSSLEWEGKAPGMTSDIGTINVSHEFGKTVGWQIKEGRDFSSQFSSDSMSVIINEAAVEYMGLKNPVGSILRWGKQKIQVIGVVKNLLMQSPYSPVKQTIFYIDDRDVAYLNLRLNAALPVKEALTRTEAVFKQFIPSTPFRYQFVDEDFAAKFNSEERIGKLAGFFAILAIFISSLGLFGMAAFVTEQRTKEIGIRKTLGASVINLWQLLSKDFMLLVLIAFFIAVPIAYTGMQQWLSNYEYRTNIPWWIFLLAGICAMVTSLLTVSYQSIKAALANPVKSLKSE